MIVRIVHPVEFDLGLVLEKFDHPGGGVEIGFDAVALDIIAGFLDQIGAGMFDVVALAGRLLDAGRIMVAGHPQHAARRGGGAAEHGFLFHHQHLEPRLARDRGGGEPRRARTRDQHVDRDFLDAHAVVLSRAALRPAIRPKITALPIEAPPEA